MKKNLKRLLLGTVPALLIGGSIIANSCGESAHYDLYLIAGVVNDGSFNQQSYDAMNLYASSMDLKSQHITPLQDYSNVSNLMREALDDKAQAVILSGFYLQPQITDFFNTGDNKQKAMDQKTHYLLVDNDIGTAGTDNDSFYGLEFSSEEAGILAGVEAAFYSAHVSGGKGAVATFGGGLSSDGKPIRPVYSYMNGFAYGVALYNQIGDTGTAKATKQIKLLGVDGTTNLIPQDNWGITTSAAITKSATTLSNMADYYKQGFRAGDQDTIELAKKFIATTDAIFPVAGPRTQDVIAEIARENNTRTKVVGVDTPNENQPFYADVSNYFLGSAIKNIQQMTSFALTSLGSSQDSGQNMNWCTNGRSQDPKDIAINVCRGGLSNKMIDVTVNNPAQKSPWVNTTFTPAMMTQLTNLLTTAKTWITAKDVMNGNDNSTRAKFINGLFGQM